MKVLFCFFLGLTVVWFAHGGVTVYLPEAGKENTCENTVTYNQCRYNALALSCSDSDQLCNCKQAQRLVQCFPFCTKDVGISALETAQSGEVGRVCKGLPASLTALLPSATSTVQPSTDPQPINSPPLGSTPISILSSAHKTHVLMAWSFVLSGILMILML
ncbi:hypothetical protein K7432_013003 [Basidiobolus ranarum]|uniref:Uncharacterized protein n=1 Tax=Basidiobolus ranarum TaxID=34480 RepID=A0ABR2WJW7_9FUNG